MDLDDQMVRYFGTADPESLSTEAFEAGTDRMAVDFGLETDPGRRFALWTMMFMLGAAPDLDIAFKDPQERDAARNFMDLMDRDLQG